MKQYADKEEFGEYELEYLPLSEIDYIAYSYQYECYEGSGHMIIRFNNGKYDMGYLGHCSCYGPTDNGESYSPTYTKTEINKRVGKDLNGNKIEVGEWDSEHLLGMWRMYEKAEKERKKKRAKL